MVSLALILEFVPHESGFKGRRSKIIQGDVLAGESASALLERCVQGGQEPQEEQDDPEGGVGVGALPSVLHRRLVLACWYGTD